MQRTCDETRWEPSGRPMRLFEWLAILAMLGAAGAVRAEPIYKCEDAKNNVAYQSQPCSAGQTASEVEISPAPQFAPSPQYAIDHSQASQPRQVREVRHAHREREATAFECRASDGQVFYRHSGCPHSIAREAASNDTSKRGKSQSSGGSVSVSSQRIPLDEACRQMRTAGAIGRSGHAHDETVSTYDRNLGRDPCH